VLASCGGGSHDPQNKAGAVLWREGAPVVLGHRHGSLPAKLVVKNIRVGSGATLEKGRTVAVRYRSFDYRTGRRYEDWWSKPFETGYGRGESLPAWERGLKGMRVGGRRVLIVPAKQAYSRIPVVYVLELIKVS